MGRRLFTVEDVFQIRGRGLVLVPGIAPIGDEVFRVGDTIMLRRPDGSILQTEIAGLEFLCPNPRHDVVVMLRALTKNDVPIGTEVWSVPQTEADVPIQKSRSA